MLTVGRAAGRAGRESHECWIVSVSWVSPIVTAALSSEAELRKQRRSIKLSSYVDVIAATSVCYRKLDSFPICKCNRVQQPSEADPAVLRRTHA
jgi:hypothetical protein